MCCGSRARRPGRDLAVGRAGAARRQLAPLRDVHRLSIAAAERCRSVVSAAAAPRRLMKDVRDQTRLGTRMELKLRLKSVFYYKIRPITLVGR